MGSLARKARRAQLKPCSGKFTTHLLGGKKAVKAAWPQLQLPKRKP